MTEERQEFSRTYSRTLPTAVPAGDAKPLDGLRQMIAGEVPPPPIVETLGFQLAEVEEGRAVFTSRPETFHYNPFGTAHGGYAAAILDPARRGRLHDVGIQGQFGAPYHRRHG